MNPLDLVKEYLAQVMIMQLATSDGNEPWACNVHFYADDDLNIYWLSTQDRVHSKHIVANPNVAAAILVHENTAQEPHVIGVSISGQAELVAEDSADEIHKANLAKFTDRKDLIGRLTSGENPHVFYKFTPKTMNIFDTKNFPESPRQEVDLATK